jgi:hypothetical protein
MAQFAILIKLNAFNDYYLKFFKTNSLFVIKEILFYIILITMILSERVEANSID